MTAVSVAADNARYDAMDATTNVGGFGGGAGAGAEPDIVYQGTNSVSRKVTAAGFYTSTGTPRDMTATGRTTWLVKTWLTNYASLSTTGNSHEVRIGSGTGDYYSYVIGSPTVAYPARGGFVIDAIDPSIAAHRDGTTGTPVLTATDVYGAFATCSTSKVENLVLDAVDVGVGLYLTGGTSPDPAGDFDDFLADDEGDTTNGRFGYIFSAGGIPNVLGRLIVGATSSSGTLTATAARFSDTGRVVIFPENRAAAGFSGLTCHLGNATTEITLTRCSLTSRGTAAGEDTRAVLEAIGTSGTLTITGGSVVNFASLDLTSGVTLDSVVLVDVESITQSGATLTDCTISGHPTATGVAMITSDDPALITGCSFDNTGGTGHAIEATTAGTYTWTDNTTTGYGADGTNNAAFYNNSGGAITLNVSGGNSPTVRNGTGASTTVVNAVTVRVTVLDTSNSPIANARVRIEAAAGGDLSAGTAILEGLTSASGIVENTGFAYTNPQPITGRVRKASSAPYYKTAPISGSISSNGFESTIFMVDDQ